MNSWESSPEKPKLPIEFVNYASGIIKSVRTLKGWSVAFNERAVARDVSLPIKDCIGWTIQPYIARCLAAFDGVDQYEIIETAVNQQHVADKEEFVKLRKTLYSKYSKDFGSSNDLGISEPLVEETKHWLKDFPQVLSLYEKAEEKYRSRNDPRAMMDDLRLALETLLKKVLNSDRVMENLTKDLKSLLHEKGGTVQITSMLGSLLNFYSAFQNENVKHRDRAQVIEAELVFDLTSSFLRHIVRMCALSTSKDAKPN